MFPVSLVLVVFQRHPETQADLERKNDGQDATTTAVASPLTRSSGVRLASARWKLSKAMAVSRRRGGSSTVFTSPVDASTQGNRVRGLSGHTLP